MSTQPSGKTTITVLGGAIVTIAAWALTGVWNIYIPPEIAAAATTLVTGIIALLIPAKSGKYVDWAIDPGADDAIDGEHPDGDYPAGDDIDPEEDHTATTRGVGV